MGSRIVAQAMSTAANHIDGNDENCHNDNADGNDNDNDDGAAVVATTAAADDDGYDDADDDDEWRRRWYRYIRVRVWYRYKTCCRQLPSILTTGAA